MKASSNKSRLTINKESFMNLKIGNTNTESRTYEKLPGVKVYKKLNFYKHLDGLSKGRHFNEFIFYFKI